MHPSNPYHRNRPDFAALAKNYPYLAPHVTIADNNAHLDFTNADALRALTTALLHHDFNLTVKLRDDRLCPTLANRLDYVHLCLDIAKHAPPRPLKALDIGTGHVAIYALLLSHYGVSVTATELDPISLSHARSTVTANNAKHVTVLPPPQGNSLLGYMTPDSEYSFSLCNPPFFSSLEEKKDNKGPAPAAPTASSNEEITPGGEVGFIGKMVDESVGIGERCSWYTSLVGRYASLPPLVNQVKTVTSNYYVVQLRQARTIRWILVWGYTGYRLPDTLTRPAELEPWTSYARLLPLPNTFRYTGKSVADLIAVVVPVLKEVWLFDGDEEEAGNGIELQPRRNTWSRAARRKLALAEGEGVVEGEGDSEGEPLFRATLTFEKEESGATLKFDWTFGRDRDVVDAFWKFLTTKAGLKRGREEQVEARSAKRPNRGASRARDNGWGERTA